MLYAIIASAVGFLIALYLYLFRPFAHAKAQGRPLRFPLIAWAIEWMQRDLVRLRERLTQEAMLPAATPMVPPIAPPPAPPIYEGLASLYTVLADGAAHLIPREDFRDAAGERIATIPVVARVPAGLGGYTTYLQTRKILFYVRAIPVPGGYDVTVVDDDTDRPVAFPTWVVGGAIRYVQDATHNKETGSQLRDHRGRATWGLSSN